MDIWIQHWMGHMGFCQKIIQEELDNVCKEELGFELLTAEKSMKISLSQILL